MTIPTSEGVSVRVSVDRVEGDLAVLCVEDGRSFELPAELLPQRAGEGDWLTLGLRLDPESADSARSTAAATRARLAVDDDGGDFAL